MRNSGRSAHKLADRGSGAIVDEAAPRKPRRRMVRRIFLLIALAAVGIVVGFKAWQWAIVPRGAPVIGVSLDTAWHSRLGITTTTYQTALARSKAKMFSIRPGEESADQILDRIDALLLTGGGDVDPALYGGDTESAKLVDRRRDEFELALIRGALERDMPILGICRGIQILNVAHEGTLRNLREDSKLAEVHGLELDSLEAHAVDIAPGSHLGLLYGAGEKQVNSFHGQAVDRVGTQLRVTATSPDGVVEALERSDRRFVVVMQWHPEILSLEDAAELAVFRELVKHARAYRQEPR